MKRYRMWIDGSWADAQGGALRRLVNPATGETLAHVPEAGEADVKRAILAGRTAQDEGSWSRMAAAERSVILLKLADLVKKNAASLARLDSQCMGKPIAEAQRDAERAVACFERGSRLAAEPRSRAAAQPIYRPDVSIFLLSYEATGVIAQIVPWSSPLLMTASAVAPALAAGCACVVKPADETPLSALELGRLASRAGLPAGVLNVLSGEAHRCAEALMINPGIDLRVLDRRVLLEPPRVRPREGSASKGAHRVREA